MVLYAIFWENKVCLATTDCSSSDKNLIRIYTARPNRAALSARIFSGKTYVCHRSKPLAVIIFGVSIVADFLRMDGNPRTTVRVG
jgi:hypothetical protein